MEGLITINFIKKSLAILQCKGTAVTFRQIIDHFLPTRCILSGRMVRSTRAMSGSFSFDGQIKDERETRDADNSFDTKRSRVLRRDYD